MSWLVPKNLEKAGQLNNMNEALNKYIVKKDIKLLIDYV